MSVCACVCASVCLLFLCWYLFCLSLNVLVLGCGVAGGDGRVDGGGVGRLGLGCGGARDIGGGGGV